MDRPYTIDHLDHLVLRVRDLERAVDFYSTLGGVVCIRRGDTVSLEMGGDTRVTLKHEPDFEPPTVSSVEHVNFAVNAASIDAVADFLRASGVEVFEEEISHTSPSIRMLDPERNVVEIRLAGPRAADLQQGSLRRQTESVR